MKKKMNVVKWRCCVIGVCMFFGGCGPECPDDPNLNAQDFSWVFMYSSNQLLHFKSDTGSIDTILISIASDNQHSSENGCSRSDQVEIVDASLFNGSFTVLNNSIFKLRIQHGNKYFSNNQYSNGIPALQQLNGLNFTDYTPQNNIVLNGKSYNGVYIMPSNNKPNNFTYYNKQYGVIAYDDWNGHQWVKIN